MSEKSELIGLGLAHKFALAWEKAGGTPADLNKAAEDPAVLRKLTLITRGLMKAEFIAPIIDCDAQPFMPTGWVLAPDVEQFAGRVTGKLTLSTCLLDWCFLEDRSHCGIPYGSLLAMRLPALPVLTAHVLDCLLEYPEFIPDLWKATSTYFPGTLYNDKLGRRWMRGLRWDWESQSWKAIDGQFPPSKVESIAVLQY